ncbi:glycosyl transferase, group 1 family protein [Candidatus Thiomargarita nelsonii]|uniref:Glycosyl transferase, group 1 family protein n=1 Tax=Candidatus Thiomargarita nelsonii TaxID=1003181 RepID=A0A176RSI1_9GAMM|nr:glycosyl transferase, group 1 family protein [Candidatus Thiomargarita nelsonii]
MKILLSAFACHPHHGSEPGVGWHWAIEIAKIGHEVWVLTHTENKVAIEAVLEKLPALSGKLHFIYYHVTSWLGWWRRDQRGIYPYYVLWQWGAYRFIKKIQGREQFDLVHHITYGGVRVPSFMGGLGIPFIFGPVGGGERAPWRLRFGYSLRGWFIDALRDMSNAWIKISPLMRLTFRQAKMIYVRSSHTRQLIPKKFRSKTQLYLGIGLTALDQLETVQKHNNSNYFQVLYAGRFLHWKGMHLGLPAFARLLKIMPEARMTLVGNGPDEKRWHWQADKLGLNEHIDWLGQVSQSELFNLYSQHDVLLFPSLRDSAGMVVLEAMRYGLPVICLDLGGPGMMVDASCGRVIATQNATEQIVIQKLGEALIELAQDATVRDQLAQQAQAKAQTYTWENVVRQLYQGINHENY